MIIISISFFLFILIELIAVSYGDVKNKRISNYWSLLNIFLFLVFSLIFPKIYPFFWPHFIFPVAFFVVGIFLFSLKIMGGGDSKFLSTFFLLIPYQYQQDFFMALLVSTIVIGSILLIHNTFNNFNKILSIIRVKQMRQLKEVYGTKFSYAPVILFSWVFFCFREYFEI